MIQFPRPPSKLGSENPKKSYLGKLKIVPRFEFLLECGVIGNYLIVEVGIKKLLGEMMRIAH